tara:strand:+ start:666 stop:1415 length:750 start_codon:yes stop_codon:yes gene_type:complete
MSYPEKIIYLNPLELTGPEQMAIDLFLLEKSFIDKQFHMAIRFYTWTGNWLSIGKNQKELPKTWLKLLNNGRLKIVRRPSGGQAVLHSKGLTYALVWKSPPRNKKESYLKTTKWLKDGLKKAGVDLFFGNENVTLSNSNCFATSTLADLVDKDKNKHIGSAQYWKKGHLLQHGEILIEPSKILWKKVFNTDPPKIKKELKEKDKLINFLKESFIQTWPGYNLSEYRLDEKDKEFVKHLARSNFKQLAHF